jgi:hypothetical protein
MDDPRTFWLIVTNIILGIAVLLAVIGVLTGTLCELMADWKKRRNIGAELDRDLRNVFGVTRFRK